MISGVSVINGKRRESSCGGGVSVIDEQDILAETAQAQAAAGAETTPEMLWQQQELVWSEK